MRTFPRYMMATAAYHLLGDIGRDPADLCIVHGVDGDSWVGNWVEGFGLVDVRFPMATTRILTADEIAKYDGRRMSINSTPLGRLHVRGHV